MFLLSSADILKKKLFRDSISVSNNLDSDQDGHSVGPNLGPNCLQRLSAEDIIYVSFEVRRNLTFQLLTYLNTKH